MTEGQSAAAEYETGTVLNQGIIVHPASQRGRSRLPRQRTLIVTGLARSGTSMVAALLLGAGIPLGEHVSEPVNEDAEIAQILRARDLDRLDAVIARHNAKAAVWGFKMPDLHLFLQHDEFDRFRNPRLIAIYRDPVAVAARNALSEHVDGVEAMIETTTAMHTLLQFVRATRLPFLLLSYEKALLFPQVFIENLLNFCAITPDDAMRSRLMRHVQPNRAQYVMTSKRAFEGHLDGVLDGKLHGWARHIGSLMPVLLDLLIDERLVAIVKAGDFRGDLQAAGVGNGNHGFSIDLREHGASDAAVIRMRVSRRTFELGNSGMSLAELRALHQ